MSDEKESPSIPPLLRGALGFLGVSGAALASWAVAPSGDWTLPAKVLAPIGTAAGSLVLIWVSWTYRLWKRDDKRIRVREAVELGRPVCTCTDDGEIMLLKRETGYPAHYRCPKCGLYQRIGMNQKATLWNHEPPK
jgi:hypothetical protein